MVVSPQETNHALISWVVSRIQAGALDKELKEIRSMLLSTIFQFEVLPEDDDAIYFRGERERQSIAALRDACAKSPVQMCFDVIAFKKRKDETLHVIIFCSLPPPCRVPRRNITSIENKNKTGAALCGHVGPGCHLGCFPVASGLVMKVRI